MKLKLLFLSFILPLFSLQAQNNLSITGKVTDKSNAPISYATVTIKEGETVITGSITDDSGNFEVKGLAPKNYTIDIQFIGYKPYLGKADLTSGKSIALNKITLADEAKPYPAGHYTFGSGTLQVGKFDKLELARVPVLLPVKAAVKVA